MDGGRSSVAAGGILAGISLLVGLQFPFLFPKSAPYMATPGSKIRKALQFLNKATKGPRDKKQDTKEPPLFVDLGSGDGQAVYEAARLGYRAVGIEFNWTLWAVSSIRRQLFWTPQEKSLSSFLRQDFHSYNLQDADTIMIFAIPRTMPVLGKKIQQECKLGTDILAYRFGIPLSVDQEIPHDNDPKIRLDADLIYHQQDMRIYRTTDKQRLVRKRGYL
jgi:SAM-dependent methyltransferase